MDWSAAVPSWNPSQLPGLVTNRTLLSAPLFTGPSEPSPAPVFDPIAAKVAIIDQLCIQDLQKKEQLVAATRLTNFDATLNAALNVCMEEILSILSQSASNTLESSIQSLLVSPDAPGGLWVRLMVALCLAPRNEFSRSLQQPLHKWFKHSSLLVAPICILGLHIHRVVVPDLIRVLEAEISTQNPTNTSANTSIVGRIVDALEYISAVRPASVAAAVETLPQLLVKAMKTSEGSRYEFLSLLRALVDILEKPKLFDTCALMLLNRISSILSSEPHLENTAKNFIRSILQTSPDEVSLLTTTLGQLQQLLVSRSHSLASPALGQLLLILQRFVSSPPSTGADASKQILSHLYQHLLSALSSAEADATPASQFAQLLRGVLENPLVEQNLDPNTFNMLFRWMSLATAVAERESKLGSSFAPIHVNQSDKFVSMMAVVFRSAYPAFYIDKQVLSKLDSARSSLTAQDTLNILKNLRLHIEEDLDSSPTSTQILSRELKKNIPMRLLLNAVEVDTNDVETSKQLLQLSMWLLVECATACTPMNVYSFLQAALELLLDLTVSKTHPEMPESTRGSNIPLQKVEWLQQAISMIAGQNLHLHNVAVAFAIKHLCNPETATATLQKRRHKKPDLIQADVPQSAPAPQDPVDRAPKRQALVETSLSSMSHKMLPHQRTELPAAAQGCLLQIVISCLRIGERDPAERLAVVTEQLLLRVTPPLPAASNEHYAEILPRKPVFERDVAIEHQLAKAPVIMSLLQLVSTVPTELVRCLDIIKSILALTIGGWNQQVSSLGASSSSSNQNISKTDFRAPPALIASTQQLWSALSAAQLVPPIMQDIGDIFAFCQPTEAVQMLMSAWAFIKDNPPVIGLYYPAGGQSLMSASGPNPPDVKFERRFNGDVNKPYSNLILFFLRKYVHKLPSLLVEKTRLIRK